MIGGIFLRRLQLQGLHSLTWWVSSLPGDICNLNLILKEGRNSYSIYGWVIWGERPNLTTANVKGQTWLELRWFEGKSRKGNQTIKHLLRCESHLSCRTPGTAWNETTDWVLKRWTHRTEAVGKVRRRKTNGGFQAFLKCKMCWRFIMTSQDRLNTATQCATGTHERPPLTSLFGAVRELGVITQPECKRWRWQWQWWWQFRWYQSVRVCFPK